MAPLVGEETVTLENAAAVRAASKMGKPSILFMKLRYGPACVVHIGESSHLPELIERITY